MPNSVKGLISADGPQPLRVIGRWAMHDNLFCVQEYETNSQFKAPVRQ